MRDVTSPFHEFLSKKRAACLSYDQGGLHPEVSKLRAVEWLDKIPRNAAAACTRLWGSDSVGLGRPKEAASVGVS